MEVAEAEGAAKDRRLCQGCIRLFGKMGGASLNQSPHCRWQQALSVPREGPDAVYFLDEAGFAIGAHLLGEDKGHALGLGVHRGSGGRVDLAGHGLLEELDRFELTEPAKLETANKAHSLHVCHELQSFVSRSQLVRPRREYEEDRAGG